MATEYKLSYTAAEIDEKLGKIDNAVLFEKQTLTDEQKAQARKNIGAGEGGGLTNTQIAKCKEYSKRFIGVGGEAEAFLFFTDPHFGESYKYNDKTEPFLTQIAEVYNHTPTTMCVCGGDWLNNLNTKENACWQLGVYDGLMKKLFDNYVMVLGNHDTNYQGYDYIQSGADGTYDREEHEKCILSRDEIKALWYRKQRNAYFTVDGGCTKFYVFDTQLDWYPEMDEYKWGQVEWFAESLLEDKPARCAALVHIAGKSTAVTPFISAITQVAKAYNDKTTVTMNGTSYDFSEVSGKFYFVIGGHTHSDLNFVVNGIPIVTVTNTTVDASTVTFDLILADYENDRLHMVRVGSGSDRLVSLIDGNIIADDETGDDETGDDGTGDDVVDDTTETYEIVVSKGKASKTTEYPGVQIGNYTNNMRACLLASGGPFLIPLHTMYGGTTTDYSLIRIPSGATRAYITGSGTFDFDVQVFERLGENGFNYVFGSEWIAMTGYMNVYDIPSKYSDGNHYMSVGFRLTNEREFVADDFKSVFSLSFEPIETSSLNVFDIGTSVADYTPYREGNLSVLSVDPVAGTLVAPAYGGSNQVIFRNTQFVNDGSRFCINLTVSNDVSLSARVSILVRAFDSEGTVVTDWKDPVFVYASHWNANRAAFEMRTNEGNMRVEEAFVLPSNVETFQIGFIFTRPENATDDVPVTIKDISLTKA